MFDSVNIRYASGARTNPWFQECSDKSIGGGELIGQVLVGVVVSSGWLFVRFAQKSGFDTADTAFLAALFFSSGFILQFPIGWLSDRSSDRRNIIIVVSIISAILAVFILLGAYLPFGILATLIFLFGSISATLFALNIAYGQDFVEQEKSAEYGGRLFIGYAAGALLGPLIATDLVVWLYGDCFGFAKRNHHNQPLYAALPPCQDRILPSTITTLGNASPGGR